MLISKITTSFNVQVAPEVKDRADHLRRITGQSFPKLLARAIELLEADIAKQTQKTA